MMKQNKQGTFLDRFVQETKTISKRIVTETGKTYQSFKINRDIVTLKRRRRERFADLGLKAFSLVKKGSLSIPGVDYLISELKALEFQIKLKEEDLAEIAAAETMPPAQTQSPRPEAGPTKPGPQPVSKSTSDITTVKLAQEKDKKGPLPQPGMTEKRDKSDFKKPVSPKKKPKPTKAGPPNAFSNLKGIGPKLADKFIKAGYDSIEKLAKADPKDLAKLLARTEKTARKYSEIAQKALKQK
ncbi:hypothetical protein JXQ70_19800 [bacterium]|nr:hypothetical protein [bacterium]